MNLEIRHLKLVAAIAQEGGVTKAGSRLHLTQSALSHQLRDIEERLGTALFARLNKKMVLTPAGERLLASAQTVLDEIKRAEEDIRQIALCREGILRISTECYTCYHWLPSLLRIFNQRFPRIEVQIKVESTQDPVQALLDGQLDLAIMSGSVRNSKLSYNLLFQDELLVIMSPHHPLAARPFMRAEDFADQTLMVHFKLESTTVYQKVLLPAGVMPRQVLQVQLTEALIEMVKAGLGICVMARWAVAPHIESGAVRVVPLTARGIYRRWSAVTLRNKSAPPYLQAFIELLTDNVVMKIRKDTRKAAGRNHTRLLHAVECLESV